MRASRVVLALTSLMIIAAAVAGVNTSEGRSGGMTTANYSIGSCECHGTAITSTATVTAMANNLTPNSGDLVTISVTVKGGQQTPGQPLAVLINTGANRAPAADGWAVVSDPAGTGYDFNQIAWSSPHTFNWTMNAPSTGGARTLNIYVLHGNGGSYRTSTSLTFEVNGPPPSNVAQMDVSILIGVFILIIVLALVVVMFLIRRGKR